MAFDDPMSLEGKEEHIDQPKPDRLKRQSIGANSKAM